MLGFRVLGFRVYLGTMEKKMETTSWGFQFSV